MALINPLRYDTPDDVRNRLNNTVAFYRNRPVYLMAAERGRDLEVQVMDLLEGNPLGRVHSSDEELDVQAKPMGYMNTADNRVLYATRMPSRRAIQCLSPHTLVMFEIDGALSGRVRGDEYRTQNFGKMLLNDYPSLADALATIDVGNSNSIAFGRKLALKRHGLLIRLYYFTHCVGVYNKQRSAFAVPDRLAHYVPFLQQQHLDCFTGAAGG